MRVQSFIGKVSLPACNKWTTRSMSGWNAIRSSWCRSNNPLAATFIMTVEGREPIIVIYDLVRKLIDIAAISRFL